MLLEKYVDMGLLMYQLIGMQSGVEITFARDKVTVKGKDGIVKEVYGVRGITIHNIECAIEATQDS